MAGSRTKASNRLVRKAIREIMEPQIAELGFTGKYPDYRRDHSREVHFLHFYTRKYGGGFSYSGAWAKRTPGTDWGERDISHTDFDNRAHVSRIRDLCTVDGKMVRQSVGDFDYEHIADDEHLCRDLVREAASTLPQMDRWLKTREPDEAISCKGHKPRHGLSPQFQWHMAAAMAGNFSLDARRPESPHLDSQREADTVDYPKG